MTKTIQQHFYTAIYVVFGLTMAYLGMFLLSWVIERKIYGEL